MIVRGFRRDKTAVAEAESTGFDSFELRLGDMMRGERATLGKSLLDVQRELKIKAAYIAAIENADPTAFDTPGFIAGYVRSYARYLNMDPDWAFEVFCRESGFSTAHGMSADASALKATREERMAANSGLGRDIFSASTTPFVPAGDRMFSGVEPRALGSIGVLVALIGGLGYGGWSLLQEVQKVTFAPVEQSPTVVAEVDPLAGATTRNATSLVDEDSLAGVNLPSPEALDRLYRPQALDTPVMVARDGPIAALDPRANGSLAAMATPSPHGSDGGTVLPVVGDSAAGGSVETALAEALNGAVPAIQVTEPPKPGVTLVATYEAWMRVRAADGSVIYEGTMFPGDTFELPQTEEPATLRVGASGAVFFAVNGLHYGPAGPRGAITDGLVLSAENLTERYAAVDLDATPALAEAVRVAEANAAIAE